MASNEQTEQVSAEPRTESGTSATPLSIDASRSRQDGLTARIQAVNAEWRTGFSEMSRQDVDIALKLAQCTNPAEAMQICNEWVARRVDLTLTMQKQFLDIWFQAASANYIPVASPLFLKATVDDAEGKS